MSACEPFLKEKLFASDIHSKELITIWLAPARSQ